MKYIIVILIFVLSVTTASVLFGSYYPANTCLEDARQEYIERARRIMDFRRRCESVYEANRWLFFSPNYCDWFVERMWKRAAKSYFKKIKKCRKASESEGEV